MNTWEQIKNQIKTKISAEAYQNWVSKTVFLRAAGDQLHVGVPYREIKEWIEQEYAGEISAAIADLKLGVTEVVYEVHTGEMKPPGAEKGEIVFQPSVSLNPKFTFDSFVVGS